MVRTAHLVLDVLLPFVSNRLLLEALAISDVGGFRAKDHLKWVVRHFCLGGGRTPEALPGDTSNPTLVSTVELCGEKLFANDTSRDDYLAGQCVEKFPCIGVPGGYLGIQAFYLILENFWRNLVKHNAGVLTELITGSRKRIEIHLDIKEDPDNTKLWLLELWSPVTAEVKTVNRVNALLGDGVIDGSLQLIADGWGTKEMMVAAAALVGRPLSDVRTKGPEVLKCEHREGKYLAYGFRLLKPQRIHVCTGHEATPEEQKARDELMAFGVSFSQKLDAGDLVVSECLVCRDCTVRESSKCKLAAAGGRPLKCFSKDIDVLGLKSDAAITTTQQSFESEFCSTLRHATERCELLVFSPEPEDKKLDGLMYPAGPAGLTSAGDGAGSRLLVRVCTDQKAIAQACEERRTLVVYDRHGILAGDKSLFEGMTKLAGAGRCFWEPYGAATATASLLQHVPDDQEKRRLLALEIVSAAFTRVVVLDERIQGALDRDVWWTYGGRGVRPIDCLRLMGVHVPPRQRCPLDAPDRSEIWGFVKKHRPHIVSIHAGILDKIGCKTPDLVKKWIREMKDDDEDRMDSGIRRVAVHSGRGIPSNMPELDVPFLSYSAVEHWTTSRELKSKYALVQELLAARGVVKR